MIPRLETVGGLRVVANGVINYIASMALLSKPADSSSTQLLRTADVLDQTGITHQVLYRYITIGLIEPARTLETGLRFFHPRVVLTIQTIQSLTRAGGYSLRDLKEIFFKDDRVRKKLVGDSTRT